MKSRTSLFMLLTVAALTFLSGPAAAVVYYVDGQNGEDPNDGLSWDTAKATIQAAVDTADPGDEIWVEAGTYYISSQIQINEAIGIYGGFAGDENLRSERDWVGNVTTIDGQNSVRILQITDEPIIDGFTLTNGYYEVVASIGGGGAIYIGPGAGGKTPRISNCIMSDNYVNANPLGGQGFKGGGAIYAGTGNSLFVNCLITNNSTNAYGGAVNMYAGSPDFINCTISNNTALQGGGAYLQGVDTILEAEFYNCIVRGNTGTTDANDLKVKLNGDEPQGGNNCSSVQIGTGTILTDPLFLDPDNEDYHLKADSPCIDAGDSSSVPADATDLDGDGDTDERLPFDLDGRPRFIDDPNTTDTGYGPHPIVDIGVYEFGAYCGDAENPSPVGDINNDCRVNLGDFVVLGLSWLAEDGGQGWNPDCNLYDADLIIDTSDLKILGAHWLECSGLYCD